MRLDHGVLNLPLAKRGNLDAELDRYRAQQQRKLETTMRTARAQFTADKAKALTLIAALTDAHCAELAASVGCQPRSVRKLLRERASVMPAVVVSVLERAA